MLKPRFKLWLYQYLQQGRSKHRGGFTLIELLVSIVIASIVVSGLLFLVVELLRIDRRELSLEQVQRDMQRAVDYMSDDLKEAVYVYSDETELTRIVSELDDLQTDVTNNGAVPILAFWRPRYHSAAEVGSSGGACAADSTTCTLLQTRGATYSLVVYYLLPPAGTVQEGKSHIRRYELKEYTDITSLTATTGYASPITTESGTQFETWTSSGTISAADTDDNALVDYVGAITNGATPNNALCNNYTETPLTSLDTAYNLVPSTATTDSNFFVCIRDSTPDEISELGATDATTAASAGLTAFRSRQDVYLFLRGDAQPDGVTTSFLQPASEKSRLPILQTQVLVGGVISEDSVD